MNARIWLVGLAGITLVASGCGTQVASPGSQPSSSPSTFSSSRGSGSVSPSRRTSSPSSTSKTSARPSQTIPMTAPKDWNGVPPLDAVDFVSNHTGFIAGVGAVYRTTSSGQHWTRDYTGSVDIVGLDMMSASQGWVWSAHQLLQDMGGKWTVMSEPAGGPLTAVDFVQPQIGYGIANGAIVKTQDGGRRWASVSTPFASARALVFTSTGHGVAVAQRRLWATTDGGRHWTAAADLPLSNKMGSVDPTPLWSYRVDRGPQGIVWILARGSFGAMGNAAYSVLISRHLGSAVHQVFNEAYMAGSAAYPAVAAANGIVFGAQAMSLAASPHSKAMAFVGENFRDTGFIISTAPATNPQHFTQQTVIVMHRANWPQNPVAIAVTVHALILVGTRKGHGRVLVSQNGGQTWLPVVP